jgi:hypothetical protein
MTDLPYRILTLEEAVTRVCAGERLTWVTMTDRDGTYDAAIEYPSHRRKQDDNRD